MLILVWKEEQGTMQCKQVSENNKKNRSKKSKEDMIKTSQE
jgi:hypothetical protein